MIEWAGSTEDGRVVARTPGGMLALEGARWIPAPSLRLEPPVHDAFEVREDCHVVRRRDRRDYGPPREHAHPGSGPEPCADRLRARRVFEGADGDPIALVGPSSEVLSWRAQRERMGHVAPSSPDGPVALVVRPIGGGWQRVTNPMGAAVVSVVPLDPPLLVSEDGDVAAVLPGVDFDVARAIVTTPRPRPLLVLELDNSSLLVARADGLWVIAGDDAARALELSAEARAWLGSSARAAEGGSVIRVLGADLGGGRAILGAGTGLVYVDGAHAMFIAIGEPGAAAGEVWGLVAAEAAGEDGWVLLTHNGVVVLGRATAWRRAGSLGALPGRPAAVSHPIGAFRGADGRPRLVAFGQPIVCASVTGSTMTLTPCGPPVDLRIRRVAALTDALVIDDQSIDLHAVTGAGTRQLPLPLPRLRHVLHGGRADAIHALTDGAVQRLDGDSWRRFATLPETSPEPRCFAVTSDERLVVGLAGGAILATGRR